MSSTGKQCTKKVNKRDGPSESIQAAALEQITVWKSSSISQLQSNNYSYFCLFLVLEEEVKNHSLFAFSASLQSSDMFPFSLLL